MRIIVLLLALHAYVVWRVAPDLPGTGWALAFAAVVGACALLIPMAFLGRRAANRARADRWSWAGMLALGLASQLLVWTVLRDLLLLAAQVLPDAWVPADGPASTALAVPLLALLATGLGLVGARRTAVVRQVAVPVAGLPAALQGLSIVQITDVHVGPTVKAGYVRAIVERVNALQPDLVAITGDLVDGRVADLSADVAPLAGLRSRHGSFFVTGNHEFYSGAAEWCAHLQTLGIQVLSDRHVVIDHGGARLVLAGVHDPTVRHAGVRQGSDPAAAIAGAPPDAGLRVLLAHQPRSAAAAAAAGFDLQLSGHTHGGQYWPWNLLVPLQQPFVAGLHRLGRLWVYVSRGTGYWGPPLRLGAPSEITRLQLVAA